MNASSTNPYWPPNPPNTTAPLSNMADTNTELVRRTTLLQGDPVEAGVVYPLIKNRTHVLDLPKEPNELAHRFITMLQGNPFLAEGSQAYPGNGRTCIGVASVAR